MPSSDYERQESIIREIQHNAVGALKEIVPDADCNEDLVFSCFGKYPTSEEQSIDFVLTADTLNRSKLILKPFSLGNASAAPLESLKQELHQRGVEVTLKDAVDRWIIKRQLVI